MKQREKESIKRKDKGKVNRKVKGKDQGKIKGKDKMMFLVFQVSGSDLQIKDKDFINEV